jgi:hypothetical protein
MVVDYTTVTSIRQRRGQPSPLVRARGTREEDAGARARRRADDTEGRGWDVRRLGKGKG